VYLHPITPSIAELEKLAALEAAGIIQKDTGVDS